jgi:hypothetical protein
MAPAPLALYYLPGRGGRLDAGLGIELKTRGYTVVGRETSGQFQRLRFSEQVEVIAEDLRTLFWHSEARVVAHSFGAYLFLHAQASLLPFPGKVLLLSPVIGGSAAPGNGPRLYPPFADRLGELARAGQLAIPARCEIHVGALDWQCSPEAVGSFGELLEIPVSVVPEAGHRLGETYVRGVLDRWLA